ncbi:MAG: LytTR family DNA-binding domain-containing protein [Erythrobacter sp.]|jgi:hypothetical protein|nr:LytTR family DNA-binding domain-containing protein [Erythrobacter sp.]
MTAPSVHASPNAEPLRRKILRGLALGLAAAFLLAFVGALGTGPAPFAVRMLYWATVILPGSALGLLIAVQMRAWGGLAHRPAAQIALTAAALSVPHTFLVIVASALFFDVEEITPGLVLNFWLAVFIVALALAALNVLAREAAAPALSEPPPSRAPGLPPMPAQLGGLPPMPALLAEQLPARLRTARLIAIASEDHYLRVHTEGGDGLVLMRMRDAAALLPEEVGARVHRSWWVARAAVTSRSVRGGRMELVLEGGLRAPVSRAMQKRIRAENWG